MRIHYISRGKYENMRYIYDIHEVRFDWFSIFGAKNQIKLIGVFRKKKKLNKKKTKTFNFKLVFDFFGRFCGKFWFGSVMNTSNGRPMVSF